MSAKGPMDMTSKDTQESIAPLDSQTTKLHDFTFEIRGQLPRPCRRQLHSAPRHTYTWPISPRDFIEDILCKQS